MRVVVVLLLCVFFSCVHKMCLMQCPLDAMTCAAAVVGVVSSSLCAVKHMCVVWYVVCGVWCVECGVCVMCGVWCV